jgi:hypothetical protein
VPLLTEMLTSEASLTAVARSGLPGDPDDSRVSITEPEPAPEPEPPAQVIIDVIKGGKRDQVVFPPHKRTST